MMLKFGHLFLRYDLLFFLSFSCFSISFFVQMPYLHLAALRIRLTRISLILSCNDSPHRFCMVPWTLIYTATEKGMLFQINLYTGHRTGSLPWLHYWKCTTRERAWFMLQGKGVISLMMHRPPNGVQVYAHTAPFSLLSVFVDENAVR